jgi:hypothetical protein
MKQPRQKVGLRKSFVVAWRTTSFWPAGVITLPLALWWWATGVPEENLETWQRVRAERKTKSN